MLSVQQEPLLGVEIERPNAEGSLGGIERPTIRFDSDHGDVAIRRPCVPEPGIQDARPGSGSRAPAGGHGHRERIDDRDGARAPAIRRVELENADADVGFRVRRGIVVDGYFQFDVRLRRGHIRAGDDGPILPDMHRLGRDQPDVAVDPAARIPARGLIRVVQSNRKDVVVSRSYKRSEVHPEGRIAVRPSAGIVPVEPDIQVGHCAVDIEEEPPVPV